MFPSNFLILYSTGTWVTQLSQRHQKLSCRHAFPSFHGFEAYVLLASKCLRFHGSRKCISSLCRSARAEARGLVCFDRNYSSNSFPSDCRPLDVSEHPPNRTVASAMLKAVVAWYLGILNVDDWLLGFFAWTEVLASIFAGSKVFSLQMAHEICKDLPLQITEHCHGLVHISTVCSVLYELPHNGSC